MVFFTCNGCGSSLKKNKAEQHIHFCKRFEFLTCIDCSKDFSGKDYALHTSCISENEKYGAAGTQTSTSKGDVKQKAWLKQIEAASKKENISRPVMLILTKLQNHPNIPQKKAKFMNALHVHNADIANQTWDLIKSTDSSTNTNSDNKKLKEVNEQKETFERKDESVATTDDTPGLKLKKKRKHKEENGNGNDVEITKDVQNIEHVMGNSEKKKSKKKRKREEMKENLQVKKVKLIPDDGGDQEGNEGDHNNDSSCVAPPSGTFPWKKVIKKCLKSADDKQLPLKRLKKKVWSEYIAFEESKSSLKPSLTQGDFNANLFKKVNKNPIFRLHKERVTLLQ